MILEGFVPSETPLTRVGDITDYAKRIDREYSQLSTDELARIVKSYENRNLLSKMSGLFSHGNEVINYITAKDILEERK